MRRDRVRRPTRLRSTLAGVLALGLVGCEKNNDTVSVTRDATAQADSRADDTSGESPEDVVAEPDVTVVDVADLKDVGPIGDSDAADVTVEYDMSVSDVVDLEVDEPTDVATAGDAAATDDVSDEETSSAIEDVASADDVSIDEIATADIGELDVEELEISVADAGGACTGPTCVGADWPTWTLTDLNPTSPTYNQPYTQPGFLGKATMLAILRSG